MTARGLGLAVAAAVLLGAGFRFGYPDLALLGAAAAAAVGGAAAVAAWRPTLTIRRSAEPDRVARGDDAVVTLTVRNGSRWRAANLIALDRCGDREVPVPVLRLRPHRDSTVSYPVPTRRRGVVAVGPLRVVRADPLGLVRMTRTYGGTATVWVHPRIHALTAVPAGLARSLDGRVDRVPHGTITFDALREYVVGDELRHVHWRTSAKVGELMVREQVDTSLPSLVVLLDDRAAAHTGIRDGISDSFEAACEAAASVVAAAVHDRLPVTLRQVCAVSEGSYLDVLTEATLCASDDDRLAPALRVLRAQRPGDTLVFLTGPAGPGDLAAVAALRGAYPLVVAGVLGVTDSVAAPAGIPVVAAEDGASFARAWDGVPGW